MRITSALTVLLACSPAFAQALDQRVTRRISQGQMATLEGFEPSIFTLKG